MTPYYQDHAVTIYHGDCREVLPALAVEGVSIVLVDPPYGDTSLEWDRWQSGWVDALPANVSQMWCFGSMRMWLTHMAEFREWSYAQEIVWRKQNGTSFHADRFSRVHEFVFHWYRGKWGALTINPQREQSDWPLRKQTLRRHRAGEHLRDDSPSLWTDDGTRLVESVIDVRNMHRRAIHPTEKPHGILDPLIQYSTNPGDLILDPFAGSCSTARAARALGRRTICIEANEQYLEAAVVSLAQDVLDFGSVA